jgi:predicted short-subunit dehydrogenase-like oxidoreductase (DUF2520 family)
MTPTSKISMFGAGNVATHLSKALSKAGYRIAQVYSRTHAKAELLAREFAAEPISSPEKLDESCDVIFFALSDDALPEILPHLNLTKQLCVHVSGSVPIDIFKDYAEYYGVMYPLQTFTQSRPVDFREIPLLIEANSPRNLSNLKSLATGLSSKVIIADSSQRRQIHLAAVFANNFTNHLYSVAFDLIKNSGFSFDILKPIILETAQKAVALGNPQLAQTGPAVRKSKAIAERHIEMLGNNPEFQNLYTFATNSISLMHFNERLLNIYEPEL